LPPSGPAATIGVVKHLGLRAWPAALVVATLVIEVAAVALSWGLEPA